MDFLFVCYFFFFFFFFFFGGGGGGIESLALDIIIAYYLFKNNQWTNLKEKKIAL